MCPRFSMWRITSAILMRVCLMPYVEGPHLSNLLLCNLSERSAGVIFILECLGRSLGSHNSNIRREICFVEFEVPWIKTNTC